jgi:hypothetical protein
MCFDATEERSVTVDVEPVTYLQLTLCCGLLTGAGRGEMWALLSGSAQVRRASAGQYERFRQMTLPEATLIQIEKDLPRTFSDNAVLSDRTEQLRRLLRAYAAYDPEVGYCQSLNYLAAILMLHMDEEDVFWTLQRTVQHQLPSGYYSCGMTGLRADHKVLSELVRRYLPRLSQHLAHLDVPLEPISTQWFMCMCVPPLLSTVRPSATQCHFHLTS